MASAALVSMNTVWPREVSSRTAAGIMPTRYSLFLISLGTPIFIVTLRGRTTEIVYTFPRVPLCLEIRAPDRNCLKLVPANDRFQKHYEARFCYVAYFAGLFPTLAQSVSRRQ